jgi:transcriptional regulator with XRE-family HTH domain
MSAELPDRTIRPNGKKIQALRKKRNWRLQDLAQLAECSNKTISSVESSKNVYRFTLNKIAKAFNVEPYTLFYHLKDRLNRRSRELSSPKPRAVLVIGIDRDINDLDESELPEFFRELADAIAANDSIDLKYLKAGSVKIGISLLENDAVRLVHEFVAGHLSFRIEDLDITDIETESFRLLWDRWLQVSLDAVANARQEKKKRRLG